MESAARITDANKNATTSTTPTTSGSESYPYRLLIVGGGPAGVSILVRAARTGHLSALLKGAEKSAGVCVVESGNENRFGAGRLQDYEINSNTWANKVCYFTRAVLAAF